MACLGNALLGCETEAEEPEQLKGPTVRASSSAPPRAALIERNKDKLGRDSLAIKILPTAK